MARVLKPGGRAIVGVPNRHDPFLRPLLATALQAVGLYAYGYEKSYSRRALRAHARTRRVQRGAETAILFIPGGLRMLDLACHSWCRPLSRVTAAMVAPFVWPRSARRHRPQTRLSPGHRRSQTGAFLILISDFHIVAVGASAGGIESLERPCVHHRPPASGRRTGSGGLARWENRTLL